MSKINVINFRLKLINAATPELNKAKLKTRDEVSQKWLNNDIN